MIHSPRNKNMKWKWFCCTLLPCYMCIVYLETKQQSFPAPCVLWLRRVGSDDGAVGHKHYPPPPPQRPITSVMIDHHQHFPSLIIYIPIKSGAFLSRHFDPQRVAVWGGGNQNLLPGPDSPPDASHYSSRTRPECCFMPSLALAFALMLILLHF